MIVGCGPAGATAAREAARSGIETVVLERDAVVGEKRVCAAGLRPGFCETFDLPRGAEWLAYSEKCRHQAYRYGSRVYGIQFHPEITAEMIADWCSQPVNCGDVEAVGPIDPYRCDTRERSRGIVEGWVKLF